MTWLIIAFALIGLSLISCGKWQGFIFWLASNAYWCWHNYIIGEDAQAVLFAIFWLLTFIGIFQWRRRPNIMPGATQMQVERFCRRILKAKSLSKNDSVKINWLFEEAKKIHDLVKEK